MELEKLGGEWFEEVKHVWHCNLLELTNLPKFLIEKIFLTAPSINLADPWHFRWKWRTTNLERRASLSGM